MIHYAFGNRIMEHRLNIFPAAAAQIDIFYVLNIILFDSVFVIRVYFIYTSIRNYLRLDFISYISYQQYYYYNFTVALIPTSPIYFKTLFTRSLQNLAIEIQAQSTTLTDISYGTQLSPQNSLPKAMRRIQSVNTFLKLDNSHYFIS